MFVFQFLGRLSFGPKIRNMFSLSRDGDVLATEWRVRRREELFALKG